MPLSITTGQYNSQVSGTTLQDVTAALTGFGTGKFAPPSTTVILANATGLNSNIPAPATTNIVLTGATGAFAIGGLAGGVDGQRVWIYNPLSQTMTITNQDASSTAANRIITGTGADIILRSAAPSAFVMKYVGGTTNRWKVESTDSLSTGGGVTPVTFVSNGGSVQVGPYPSVAGGSANFGPSAGETALEFVTVGQIFRIRQDGAINQIKARLPSITGITGFYLKIWRLQGSAFDLVGTSANLVGSISAGTNTITLGTTVNAQIGDYIGARVEYSGGASAQVLVSSAASPTAFLSQPTITYSVTNATPATSQYNWAGQTALSGASVVVEVFMAAPIFVAMGDSITSGAPTMMSFSDNWQNTQPIAGPYPHAGSFPYVLSQMLGVSHQNMGHTGEETGTMASRFAADVVAKNPIFCTIMGGVNDLLHGETNASIIANLTSMYAAAFAAGIKIVACGILPFKAFVGGGATTAMLQARDTINATISSLVTGTYGGIYISPDPMGVYFSGGDPNNLWVLNYSANSDFLHPGPAGYEVISRNIKNALLNISESTAPTVPTVNVQPGFFYAYDGIPFSWAQPQLLNTFLGPSAGYLYATSAPTPITGTNNTGVGANALMNLSTGIDNVAVGANALPATTSGGDNCAIGYKALFANTTGAGNLAVGSVTLVANTTGARNVAIGSFTMGANTTGSDNVSVGNNALQTATTVSSNTAVGATALKVATTANNTAVGFGAGLALAGGGGMCVMGYLALASATSGNFNTAFGWEAGLGLTTGGGNLFLGSSSGGGITTGSNNTVVGSATGLSASLAGAIILADGAGNIRADWAKTTASTWTLAGTVNALTALQVAGVNIFTSPTLTTPNIGVASGTSLAVTGLVKSSGTAGVGYATGAGGTIGQSGTKASGVTLSKICGQITTTADALAGGAIVSFVLTNTTIAAGDLLVLNHVSLGTIGAYNLNAQAGAGSATINITNITAGSLSESIVIGFAVVKAVTS